MSTTTVSLDTNVVIALLNQDQGLNESARDAIERSRKSSRLVVSGPVYAELLGLPARTQPALDAFFSVGGIELDWRFEEDVWRAAGIAFQSYVQRRVESTGLLPRRILTDFLIGAHASVRGYSLLTLDRRLYEASFPGIRIESF
ncbi:MAG: PIN domain-containing protein [Terracidiphilus sp.]|jgi:predicted nucleic acid-binding protein